MLIGGFGYLGYLAIRSHGHQILFAAKAGAFAGAVVGLGVAIISILAFYSVPGVQAETVDLLVEIGYDSEQAVSIASITIFSNIIFSPMINAIIGTIITLLSALITKNLL